MNSDVACHCPLCLEPHLYPRAIVATPTYHARWKRAKLGPERWSVEAALMRLRYLDRRLDPATIPPIGAEVPVIPTGNDALIVPARGVAPSGHARKKPWEYRVTATFAHHSTPDLAAACVALLRAQTERPYVVIVDTGSSAKHVTQLERLRADDCEIHYLKAHGYEHASEPVSRACDLALDCAATPLVLYTHADCFLTGQGVVKELADLCGESSPLVGYRLTEREHLEAYGGWDWMLGHTLTVVHAATARRIGARWSLQGWRDHAPPGAPFDTEYGFNWCFRRAGIAAKIVGEEVNHARNRDERIDHVRSSASAAIFDNATAERKRWLADALAEAQERAKVWRGMTRPQPSASNASITPVSRADSGPMLSPERIDELRRCRHRKPFAACAKAQRCGLKGDAVVYLNHECHVCPDFSRA